MARTKITGIEMGGGTFANYSPGMMVIGSGRGDLVTLTESDLDELEGLLEQRKAILAAQAVAPQLKWKRHPSADKVVRAESEHGVYYIEPSWDPRYDNRVQAYRISFVTGAENIAKADSTSGYVWQLGDDVVAEQLGREEFRLGYFNRQWVTFMGETYQDSSKGVAQRHAQGLFDAARSVAV